jgi:hypothetical protein
VAGENNCRVKHVCHPGEASGGAARDSTRKKLPNPPSAEFYLLSGTPHAEFRPNE